MKNQVKFLLPVLALALFGVAMNVMTASPAAATANMPVTVTNTPLPVQGSVSIGNTPNVNIANTPAVTVNSGSVSVANATDSNNAVIPLAVSNVQGQPFQSTCSIDATFGGFGSCKFAQVPQGMRLVVQNFDISGMTPSGSNFHRMRLTVQTNGQSWDHHFGITNNGPDGNGYIYETVSQRTLLFADPSTTPVCGATGIDFAPWTADCSISGHLEPAQ